MDDIDAKYGRDADANDHIVLLQALQDLKASLEVVGVTPEPRAVQAARRARAQMRPIFA